VGRTAAEPRTAGGRNATGPRTAGGRTVTEPKGRNATEPRPGGRAAARAKTEGRAAAKSRPGSGKVSDAKGRQRRFKNRMVFAYVMLLLIPLTFGIAEIAVHGGPFFVFRNNGAGAGNPSDTTDQQFLHPSSSPTASNNSNQGSPAPTPSKTN